MTSAMFNKTDAEDASQPEVCDHHWVSKHQPDLPIYWVAQCSMCGRFDAESMREEIAKTQSRELVLALAEVERQATVIAQIREWEIDQRVDHSGHFNLDDGQPCGEGTTWGTREGRDIAMILASTEQESRGAND